MKLNSFLSVYRCSLPVAATSDDVRTAARIISSCILLVDVLFFGFADAIGLQTHSILVSQTSVIRGQLADY